MQKFDFRTIFITKIAKLGFKVDQEFYRSDINTNTLLITHSCGAQILLMPNSNTERYFSVQYRTHVSNHKGLPHILEHSLLSGSQKYPLKSPFFAMYKRGMPSFLNAMTFPDKTIYPLATSNLQDYFNLVDVYQDTVYNPLLSQDIFDREAHRLVFNPNHDILERQGVVYNEMKGVLSSPQSYHSDINIYLNAFNNPIYQNYYGGNPQMIKDLTYLEFLDYYKSFYHPANSLSIFWGQLQESDLLQLLTRTSDYLSKYTFQKAINAPKSQTEYQINDTTKIVGSQIIKTINSTYPASLDDQNAPAYANLVYILSDVLSAEVLSKLMSYHFGQGLVGYQKIMALDGVRTITDIGFELDLINPIIDISLELEPNKPELLLQIKEVFEQEILKILAIDFSKDELMLGLIKGDLYNISEHFVNRPQSILEHIWNKKNNDHEFIKINVLDDHKKMQETINNQKKLIELVEKNILHSKQMMLVFAKPDFNLASNIEKQEKLELDKIKQELSDKQKQELITKEQKFSDYQTQVEDESCLPRLAIDQLDKEIVAKRYGSVKVIKPGLSLIAKTNLNQPSKVNLILRTRLSNDHDLYRYFCFYLNNFFTLPTSKYSIIELKAKLKNTFGQMAISCDLGLNGFVSTGLSLGYLDQDSSFVNDLLVELFERKNLKELLKDNQDIFTASCDSFLASIEDFINNDSEGKLNEQLQKEIYQSNKFEVDHSKQQKAFANKLKAEITSNYQEFLVKIEEATDYYFSNKNNTKMMVVNNQKVLNDISYFDNFNYYQITKDDAKTSFKPFNNQLLELNSSDTVYYHHQYLKVSPKLQETDAGALILLNFLMVFNYSFPVIRFKQGAYGVNNNYKIFTGLLRASTYRDPCYYENLNFLIDCLTYASQNPVGQSELDDLKISSINSLVPHLSQEEEFGHLATYAFNPLASQKLYQTIWEQIYGSCPEQMVELAKELLKNPEIIKGVSLKIN
jgi:presequence protease